MKKLLLLVVALFAAASQVKAGAVMPCSQGYKYSQLLGGNNRYSCTAQAGTRSRVTPLSQVGCKPGLMVTSRNSRPGSQSYTCGVLR